MDAQINLIKQITEMLYSFIKIEHFDSDIDADEYVLSVDSLNPQIIAFAPAAGSTHPR